MIKEKTISEKLIEEVNKSDLSDRAKEKIAKDIETYDRKCYDDMEGKGHYIFVVNNVDGYVFTLSANGFRNDPWRAYNTALKNIYSNPVYFAFNGYDFFECNYDEARTYLYKRAIDLGMTSIPEFNKIEGYIVSFNDLVGSIPEYMRDAFEENDSSDAYYEYNKAMRRLETLYKQEVDILLKYMSMSSKRVRVTDDEGNEDWIEVPISKIGIAFQRFQNVPEGSYQTTAYFQVVDNSPNFNPEPSFNWHCQEVSRVLYNGAIAISYSKNEETGEVKVDVSSHH